MVSFIFGRVTRAGRSGYLHGASVGQYSRQLGRRGCSTRPGTDRTLTANSGAFGHRTDESGDYDLVVHV